MGAVSSAVRIVLLLLVVLPVLSWAQTPPVPSPGSATRLNRGTFTRADTLRGTTGPYRSNYDVRFYDLSLRVDFAAKAIRGSNTVVFSTLRRLDTLQIDLFETFDIDSMRGPLGRPATWRREGRVLWVKLAEPLDPDRSKQRTDSLTIWYHGVPQQAVNPPWDGGFVWRSDPSGLPWLGVACEGMGASSWWPLKGDLADEPDSMRMIYRVPQGLMAVGNGQLRTILSHEDSTDSFEWFVTYPINSYNVTLNVADYVHFSETHVQPNGNPLQLDYYVLRTNEAKARKQFKQVKPMLACFERALGPYPFSEDGYALVETAYYGMEHQGAIAYGAKYQDVPGWGFDYIIIHESGHEWFGNWLSVADHADLWIHEGFTTYTEVLYLECVGGPAKAQAWLEGLKENIANKVSIVGPRGVNYDDPDASSDMYYKGAWMLHTLRGLVGDSLFRAWLPALLRDLAFKPARTEDVIAHANAFFKRDLGYFFAQYLYYPGLPKLEFKQEKRGKNLRLSYRWVADVADFRLPLTLKLTMADGVTRSVQISPTSVWQKLVERADRAEVDLSHAYIQLER